MPTDEEFTPTANLGVAVAPLVANPLHFYPTAGQYSVLVAGAVDGDTFDGYFLVPARFRLDGQDAAPVKTANGQRALDGLSQLLGAGFIEVALKGVYKYGRADPELMAVVYRGPTNVNQAMLDAGLAVKWDGTGPRPAKLHLGDLVEDGPPPPVAARSDGPETT